MKKGNSMKKSLITTIIIAIGITSSLATAYAEKMAKTCIGVKYISEYMKISDMLLDDKKVFYKMKGLGRVTFLETGTQVFVTGEGIIDNFAPGLRIRKKGETDEWWVIKDSVLTP
jgi:hypothetical protein